MVEDARVICASADLVDGGKGVRFKLDGVLPAFVVRHGGQVHAYLNKCPHQGVELDWMEGEFFDAEKVYLICATHGAIFAPDSGLCVEGPCFRRTLVRIAVTEQAGQVVLLDPLPSR